MLWRGASACRELMSVLLASVEVIAFNVILLLVLLLGEALTCGLVPEQRGKKDPWFFGLHFACFCISAMSCTFSL